MKTVIVNMDKKSQIKPHNLCKFQQVCTTVQISIKTYRLHYRKQSIHSAMDGFSVCWRLKS